MGAKLAAKTELSRAAIVDRALDLADTEGVAAVTVRRIAQEFGVTPMALYWHVKNKDELLDAMGDRLFDGIGGIPAEGEWSQRLRVTVVALVEALRRHPSSAHLAAPRILYCDAGRDLSEQALALLRAEGFSVAESADIARHALQTAVMLVTDQAGAEVGEAVEMRESLLEQKRGALKSLPAQRYPHLLEAADAFVDCEDVDEYYDFGVDLFINGVRAMHPSEA